MIVRERLSLVCATEQDGRTELREPFARDGWEAATNGHGLLAWRPMFGLAEGGPRFISNVLDPDVSTTHVTTLGALRGWAMQGAPVECSKCGNSGVLGETSKDCESCGGSGSKYCRNCCFDHDCVCCDATGTLGTTPSICQFCLGRSVRVHDGSCRGRILGVLFDVHLVHNLLSPLDLPDEATVRMAIKGAHCPLTMKGDGWCAVVMPLREGSEQFEPFVCAEG